MKQIKIPFLFNKLYCFIFLSLFFVFETLSTDKQNSVEELNNLIFPEGLHHYRINYSSIVNINENTQKEINTINLIGCFHSSPLSSLPHSQKNILKSLASSEVIMLSECSHFYHTKKLKLYCEILSSITKNENLLNSDFFVRYSKLRFFDQGDMSIDPLISSYFSNLIESILIPEKSEIFRQELNLDIDIMTLKILCNSKLVEKMPPKIIYDFINCYIKHTSVESQLLRLYQKSNKKNPISLDDDCYINKEIDSFEKVQGDFSLLSDESLLKKILKIYSNEIWFFSLENEVNTKVKKILEIICFISQNDRKKLKNCLVSRILFDRNKQKYFRTNYSLLYSSIKRYQSGLFPYVIPQDYGDLMLRNRNWITNKLLNIFFQENTNLLILCGTAHIGGVGLGVPYKGLLNFFIDFLKNKNHLVWEEIIGKEVLETWKSSINIYSIERLDHNGDFVLIL